MKKIQPSSFPCLSTWFRISLAATNAVAAAMVAAAAVQRRFGRRRPQQQQRPRGERRRRRRRRLQKKPPKVTASHCRHIKHLWLRHRGRHRHHRMKWSTAATTKPLQKTSLPMTSSFHRRRIRIGVRLSGTIWGNSHATSSCLSSHIWLDLRGVGELSRTLEPAHFCCFFYCVKETKKEVALKKKLRDTQLNFLM